MVRVCFIIRIIITKDFCIIAIDYNVMKSIVPLVSYTLLVYQYISTKFFVYFKLFRLVNFVGRYYSLPINFFVWMLERYLKKDKEKSLALHSASVHPEWLFSSYNENFLCKWHRSRKEHDPKFKMKPVVVFTDMLTNLKYYPREQKVVGIRRHTYSTNDIGLLSNR